MLIDSLASRRAMARSSVARRVLIHMSEQHARHNAWGAEIAAQPVSGCVRIDARLATVARLLSISAHQGLDLGACSKVYAGDMSRLTVSMLAKQTGIPPDTIRYYDRIGLLPPAARTAAGYRHYDPTAAQRLRFIKGAQRFGLRLREIAELLAVRDRGACPCGHAEALVCRRLAEIDAEIARLAEVRGELARLGAACAADVCPNPAGVWPCEVQFIDAGTPNQEKEWREVTIG